MKLKNSKLQNLLAGVLIFAGGTASASDFVNTKPLLKDATTADTGMELIIPQVQAIDKNSDGYPDKLRVELKIIDPETNTKVFNGPQVRSDNLPPNPCSNPGYLDWDWSIDFLGENNTHTGLLVVFYVECEELGTFESKESYRTMLYMADTRSAQGVTWMQGWGQEAASAHITNWDADSDEEIMLVLVVEGDDDEKGTVKMLNKATGAQEFSAKYTLSKF